MAKCPIPVTLGDLGFSVRVYSLSCKVPILASGTRFSPLHDLAVTYTLPGGSDRDMDASDLAGIHGFFQVLLVPCLQQVRHPWDHLLPLGPVVSVSFLNNSLFPMRIFRQCISK